MRRFALLAALASALWSAPAPALDVAASVFQVSFKHEGTQYVLNDFAVPLLPGNACYNWYIRTSEGDAEVRAIERFTLPVAIDWGTVGQGPDDIIQLEEEGKVAVTTLDVVTDADGWLSHGWCVAEGDPTGSHLIEVSVDGEELASFSFEVIEEGDYAFPTGAIYPARAARSVTDSW